MTITRNNALYEKSFIFEGFNSDDLSRVCKHILTCFFIAQDLENQKSGKFLNLRPDNITIENVDDKFRIVVTCAEVTSKKEKEILMGEMLKTFPIDVQENYKDSYSNLI